MGFWALHGMLPVVVASPVALDSFPPFFFPFYLVLLLLLLVVTTLISVALGIVVVCSQQRRCLTLAGMPTMHTHTHGRGR